jgi:hypothetical protein
MIRLMRLIESLGIVELMRREARVALKLSPWVLASLLLAMVLCRTDLAATGGLFQSGLETPTATVTPTPTAGTVVPTPTQTPTPVTTVLPTNTPPTTVEATVPPQATAPSTQVPLTATEPPATPTLMPTATGVPPTMTPVPSATSTPGPSDAEDQQRYAEGDSNLRFDLGMLGDTVALALSRVWLCCGILVFLSIPALFLVLWAASKRRQQREE